MFLSVVNTIHLKEAKPGDMRKNIFILMIVVSIAHATRAQDTTSLSKKDSTDITQLLAQQLNTEQKDKTEYVYATFKTTRLVSGHSVETTKPGVMDLKVSHRFNPLNSGAYNFFGLDNATMRLGFDFGITNTLMVGVGRSTFEKTFDAFFKVKILMQSTGKHRMPVTLDYVPTVALKTEKWADPNQKHYFTSRMFYTHQLIIGISDPNDIIAIGIGGRQKITKRTSFNVEYYYQLPGYKLPGSTNALSVGFDIETGGHVFQLHLTNSRGMTERQFISENTGSWGNGDILFGFNISRVFTISKKKR